MMAKHGLERNLKMAHRDAKALADEEITELGRQARQSAREAADRAVDGVQSIC